MAKKNDPIRTRNELIVAVVAMIVLGVLRITNYVNSEYDLLLVLGVAFIMQMVARFELPRMAKLALYLGSIGITFVVLILLLV